MAPCVAPTKQTQPCRWPGMQQGTRTDHAMGWPTAKILNACTCALIFCPYRAGADRLGRHALGRVPPGEQGPLRPHRSRRVVHGAGQGLCVAPASYTRSCPRPPRPATEAHARATGWHQQAAARRPGGIARECRFLLSVVQRRPAAVLRVCVRACARVRARVAVCVANERVC